MIEAVRKNKKYKTQKELDLLRLAFAQFSFFKNLEAEMGVEHVQQLYKELEYEKMNSRDVVFHLGDIGKKFYIILRGTVWILVRKEGLQDDQFKDPQQVAHETQADNSKRRRTKRKTKSSMFLTKQSVLQA